MRKLFALVFLLTVYKNVNGQSFEIYDKRTNGGLCSSTYLTFSDSTFALEEGCEGSSRFSFGDFRIFKDTITFRSWGDSNKTLVKTVSREQDTNRFLRVIILDNKGKNITRKIAVSQVDNIDRFYSMTLDSTQTYRYDYKRANSKVVLKQFVRPFKEQAEIQLLDSNSIIVTLNINGELLHSSKSKWTEVFNEKFLIDKNGFHSIMPNDALTDPYWKDNFFWIKK